jgi:hypothetical protein
MTLFVLANDLIFTSMMASQIVVIPAKAGIQELVSI